MIQLVVEGEGEAKSICHLCGELMPAGEEMFNYHGYSGPCPKPPMRTNYDQEASKAFVKQIGMFWDEPFAARVDKVAHEIGITQEQYDVIVREYAWKVKSLFTPKQYTWLGRILIAAHFLNPFSKRMK